MIKQILLALLLALPLAAHSQEMTPAQIVERFSEAMAGSDFETATNALLHQNETVGYAAYDIAQWKIMFKEEFGPKVSALGGYRGMELIHERDYAPSLKRVVYLHKMDDGFIFWLLTFYRAPAGWVISGIEVTNEPKQLSGYLKEIE